MPEESDQSVLIRAVVATIDVLQEALEMRRAAEKRYRFGSE